MKKIVSIALCACFVCMFIKADAKIRRVGFFGNQIANQDYTTLQAAHDASSSGDTLLIFPGSWSADFSHKLTVIGYGYFVTGQGANSNLQNINSSLNIYVGLYNGSDGCRFEGLDNFTLRVYNNINLVDSIKISRCKVGITLGFNNTHKNWSIEQSYILSLNGTSADYPSSPLFLNLSVQNCFIQELAPWGLVAASAQHTGIFNNNVFGTGTLNFLKGNFLMRNNIFLNTTGLVNAGNLTHKNNIATNNIIPSGNGNKPNVDITKVCVGYPVAGNYSFDERFKIKPTGPAAGAGENGEDCGMFGGEDPYHLSGIPSIPAFYKLTAPSSMPDSNPYTITFSVRGNN